MMKIRSSSVICMLLVGVFGGMAVPPALSHDNGMHETKKTAPRHHAEKHSFGRPGNHKNATRTVTVEMNDTMRFDPADISVRQGETVRFVVRNSGKIMHEMVMGSMSELKEHHEMMKRHPGMKHEDAYMVHVAPGKEQEIVWQFTDPGEFHYACLIAGHYESGMVGKIKVLKG